MKKMAVLAALFTVFTLVSKAQCDKSVTWISPSSELIDSSGNVQGNKQEKTIVEISKTQVKISNPDDDGSGMEGAVKELKCDWKEPYKNGKTIIKTDLVDPHGDVKHATITIEGKNGNIVILARAEEHPNQLIKLIVTDYSVKN